MTSISLPRHFVVPGKKKKTKQKKKKKKTKQKNKQTNKQNKTKSRDNNKMNTVANQRVGRHGETTHTLRVYTLFSEIFQAEC